MDFRETAIGGVISITPRRHGDGRGYFAETFRHDLFLQHCGQHGFVQENQSLSPQAGTVRGLHFQVAPKAQGKLVSCIAGALLDVAVDLRPGSASFGRHVAIELSAANGCQLWIPAGFAHGFCTIEPDTQVSYKVTNYYSREHERGLLWNDPELGISWPVVSDKAVLSDKDRAWPKLRDWREGPLS
jgi:dTDP-4-dehydrorhamnose 3,5-epimerase